MRVLRVQGVQGGQQGVVTLGPLLGPGAGPVANNLLDGWLYLVHVLQGVMSDIFKHYVDIEQNVVYHLHIFLYGCGC